MKKYSNDPISQIINLGDGKYEFCWNFDQEAIENHVSYSSNVITIVGTPNKQDIINALIHEGLTIQEAIELNKDLAI